MTKMKIVDWTGNTDNKDSRLHEADLIAWVDSLILMQLALESTNL